MSNASKPAVIRWRVHLRSSPVEVYRLLATPEGRSRFWAYSAAERDGKIQFQFSNGQHLESTVFEKREPERFALSYFGGSRVTFELAADGRDGTDLTLTEENVPPSEQRDNLAGWVSVLLSLKAVADFGADLRNHDPARTWEQGYIDV
jgi:uncharacterized protein YndB with AHSA1/START domain